MTTKNKKKYKTLGEQLGAITAKYPLPCGKECGLTEACVERKHCKKWVAVDFCRWRERLLLKRKLAQDPGTKYAHGLRLNVPAEEWG